MRTLVWFRGKDVRISDHEPLLRAREGGEVIPLFVFDPFFFSAARAKELPHRIQFLLESIASLQKNIEALGSRLLLASGRSTEVVPALAKKWKVDRVVAHRWTEPFARERDAHIAEELSVPFELFEGETLLTPGGLRTQAGGIFSVFTPFARAFRRDVEVPRPFATPRTLPPLPKDVTHRDAAFPTLRDLGILHNPNIVGGGERAAHDRMKRFFNGAAGKYKTERDRMDHEGTSRLSQDLKFGTLSARTVWHRARSAHANGANAQSIATFENELLWREFTHYSLWERPDLLKKPFRPEFQRFPWKMNQAWWAAWVNGTTGYPVVDASARQLLRDGFVHNRARMISASFLTKHLLIHYQAGEAHYMKWLTDGDWAQNNSGWQWSAGCGCDAQPYFRVFNPVSQGEKFDPAGDYVREYVPELRNLPAEVIHAPWAAKPEVLRRAGVVLGETYPNPIVDHASARAKFLSLAKAHLRG